MSIAEPHCAIGVWPPVPPDDGVTSPCSTPRSTHSICVCLGVTGDRPLAAASAPSDGSSGPRSSPFLLFDRPKRPLLDAFTRVSRG